MLKLFKNQKDALLKRRMITCRGMTLISLDWHKTDTFDIGANLNLGKSPMALIGISFPYVTGFITVMERENHTDQTQGVSNATSI